MTKLQIVKQIKDVDDELLEFTMTNTANDIDIFKLKVSELRELLSAFKTLNTLFRKASMKEKNR